MHAPASLNRIFHRSRTAYRVVLLLFFLFEACVPAADWPTYRADNFRSGATAESLHFPLTAQWTNQSPLPPSPAWPPPARSSIWQKLEQLQPRVEQDRVAHPILVGDRVFIASSTDDQITCLDAVSGKRIWRCFTEGPVRYAPAWSQGRLYVGSDDGTLYCLNAENGSVEWRQRIAPEDRRIPGNGRLISAWPIRTGALVDKDVVYCLAGLFPSQTVYAAAFRASDGARLYRTPLNDSPEGYLLGGSDELYVPTGRGTPLALNAKTGEWLRQYSQINGTFALVVENQLVGRVHDSSSLELFPQKQKLSLAHFPGRQMVVSGDFSYLLSDREIAAIDRLRLIRLTSEIKSLEHQLVALPKQLGRLPPDTTESKQVRETIRAHSKRLESAQTELAACERWRKPFAGGSSLILAGNHLIVGARGQVTAFERTSGESVWQCEIQGTALGLAAAHGRLFVSTDSGALIALGSGQPALASQTPTKSSTLPDSSLSPTSSSTAALLAEIESTPETRQGYAIVFGSTHESIARALSESTRLQVTVIERSAEAANSLRGRLADAGLYGPKLNVLECPDETTPLPDGVANVVVAIPPGNEVGGTPWPEREVKRLLRPFGGLGWFGASQQPFHAPPDLQTGNWTHLYANAANTASTEDPSIHADLALQWFGGPGPQSMTDRHLRATAPLVSNGRMILTGENQLLGVDAFNGTIWWQRHIPNLTRYSIPYDSGYVALQDSTLYAAVEDELWAIDSGTGETRKQFKVPVAPNSKASHWGYVGFQGHLVFGTTQRTNASRREATYKAVDDAYLNRQPMVTGDQVFCMDPGSGKFLWTHSNGAILNATLTITSESVCFLESRNPASRQRAGERIGLTDLTASEFYLINLNITNGTVRWEKPMDLKACENILYLSASKEALVIVGSGISAANDAEYHVRVLQRSDGTERWRATHANRKQGELGHGEQVHHPVLLGDLLVAEPVFYELATGKPFNPDGLPGHWPIVRPGHSCGTLSGSGRTLFFRANNPTALNLETSFSGPSRFTRLSPSRTGCWINIIPANGLVLIPEASAGCICNYSLQTSMAFRPRTRKSSP